MRATFSFNLVLRCKLLSIVDRITNHFKHRHATKGFRCKLKKIVEMSRRQFNLLRNMLFQLSTTKF